MIKCMAVDDEPWALALLKDYIGKVPFLELVYSTGSASEALHQLQESTIDLLFLDIQMPELMGIQFMKIIPNKCRFILTTAYSEYAMEGYEHNVIDYLLKPISFDRFYAAALKAKEIFLPEPRNTAFGEKQPTYHGFIFVRTDKKLVKVALVDIRFIEGRKDYIAIHTVNGDSYRYWMI